MSSSIQWYARLNNTASKRFQHLKEDCLLHHCLNHCLCRSLCNPKNEPKSNLSREVWDDINYLEQACIAFAWSNYGVHSHLKRTIMINMTLGITKYKKVKSWLTNVSHVTLLTVNDQIQKSFPSTFKPITRSSNCSRTDCPTDSLVSVSSIWKRNSSRKY